jgi:tripartite-type tricarboxylate transporter receptor subunit TctC
MPADDLKGLIAWLKSNPDKATAGMAPGSFGHIAGLFFQKSTGARFQFVPYRGAAPAIQDLVAGQIDLAISDSVVHPASGACRNDRGLWSHHQDPAGLCA